MTASSVAPSRPESDGGDADQQAAPAGQPGRAGWSGPARCPRSRPRPRRWRSARHRGSRMVAHLGVGGTEGDQLGRALGQVHHRRRQVARGRPRTSTPCVGRGPRSATGTTVAASSEARRRGSTPAAGSIHHMRATVRPPTSSGDGERGDDPHDQILQRVDVLDASGPAGRRAGRPAGRRGRAARVGGRPSPGGRRAAGRRRRGRPGARRSGRSPATARRTARRRWPRPARTRWDAGRPSRSARPRCR